MQWMMRELGGRVEPADQREYGPATVRIVDREALLFRGLEGEQPVWASHGDRVLTPAPGFVPVARSEGAPFAAVEDRQRNLFGVQFHPEVVHTAHGREVLQNFLFDACGCAGTWSIHNFVEQSIAEIREQVGEGRVICGLSGGVDSSVMAMLLHRALGDRLCCIFVDNGVLRKGEADQVVQDFRERYHLHVQYADASGRSSVRRSSRSSRKRPKLSATRVFWPRARSIPTASSPRRFADRPPRSRPTTTWAACRR
jgi:GMP synthase (glutamine-hydrolysing)